LKELNKEVVVMTEKDEQKLLEHLNAKELVVNWRHTQDHCCAALLLLIATGCRPIEACIA